VTDPELAGEEARRFLDLMEEFTPTIPDAVAAYYLSRGGLKTKDTRV